MEHIIKHFFWELTKYICKELGIDVHFWIFMLFLIVVVTICLFYLCRFVIRIIKKYFHNRKKFNGMSVDYELYTPKYKNSEDEFQNKLKYHSITESQQEENANNMSLEEAAKLFDETFGQTDEDGKT